MPQLLITEQPATAGLEEDNRPIALVYICSDERFDVEGGRIDELKAHYEALGYKVYFVRVAATANWLAHKEAGPYLIRMSRAFLRKVKLVHIEAHLTCVGLRDMFLEERGFPLKDADEPGIHECDLDDGTKALIAELRRLGNNAAEIVTYLHTMVRGRQLGKYLAN